MKNLELYGVQELNTKEQRKTNGGFIILATLAWMGIGAAICWNMAKDNREC